MIAVIQRVSRAEVRANDHRETIDKGLLVLLGVASNDNLEDSSILSKKTANLRIFEDDQGKMNRSCLDINGEVLVISQFTLLADCKKGRRPSFVGAAEPKMGDNLYKEFAENLKKEGLSVKMGQFGAHMEVELINDGPVTIILDSKNLSGKKQ